MPRRFIKDSARTSPTLDALSDGAERMFWRLVTVADDFGRFDADTRVLSSMCFPLRAGRLSLPKIERWLMEMVAVGAVELYVVAERRYGYFTSWLKHQIKRASHSRFPSPPSARSRAPVDAEESESAQADADESGARTQMRADVHVVKTGSNRDDPYSSKSRIRETTSAANGTERRSPLQVVFTPTGFEVPADLLPRWSAAYPAVDVQREVAAAFEWIMANPARRKSNYTRFLVNWLKRAQDRARPPGPAPGSIDPVVKREIDEKVRRYGRQSEE